jgi:hypothetical protein
MECANSVARRVPAVHSAAVFISMGLYSKIKIVAVLFFSVVCLVGCVTQSFDPAKAPEFLVDADYAPFYALGPGQGRGPDASLQRGERVKMLRREFGFSYVEIRDGRAGYVANEEIAPAPPLEPESSARPSRKRSQRGGAEFSNALEVPVPLPEIEALPEPVDVLHPISEIESPADSRPEFRY